MKNHPNKDFVAEAIADYEAMKPEEQAMLLVSVLEDQPFLMGFITNLADDFSDTAHQSLVDSAVILINAFVSAGVPVGMIPQALLDEVLEEKLEKYSESEDRELLDGSNLQELSDSPLVFQDLRNRALFKSDLPQSEAPVIANFLLVLDTIISMIERGASVEITRPGNE